MFLQVLWPCRYRVSRRFAPTPLDVLRAMRARHLQDGGEDEVIRELAEQGVDLRVLTAAARGFVAEWTFLASYEEANRIVH